MPNDYIKPYNLTENQKHIVHLCMQADGYVPMKGLDENDITRLFGYAFIRSPKTGYIAIAARGVAWYMEQVKAAETAEPEPEPEATVDAEELAQCSKNEQCLSGNNGLLPRSAFSKHSRRENGLQSWCKKCQNAAQRSARHPSAVIKIDYPKRHGAAVLPPPDGTNKGKPFWNCTTLAGVVNRRHGSVYNHFQKGDFGAVRFGSTYVVYEKGFREALGYYQQREARIQQQHAEAAQQVVEFVDAIPGAEPSEISEVLLPFIDTVIVQQPPADAYAALSLLVEAITCDFQRRANAHEMEVNAYWDRFVPDELRQALMLAQEYLNNNE